MKLGRRGLVAIASVSLGVLAIRAAVRMHDLRLVARLSGVSVGQLSDVEVHEDASLLNSSWIALRGRATSRDISQILSRLEFSPVRPLEADRFEGCDSSWFPELKQRNAERGPLMRADGAEGGVVIVSLEQQMVWICVHLE